MPLTVLGNCERRPGHFPYDAELLNLRTLCSPIDKVPMNREQPTYIRWTCFIFANSFLH